MKTLIQRQEACIARMNEPRTSERRAIKNRSAALREFRIACYAKGYTEAETGCLVADIRDMYQLQKLAD